MQIFQISGAMHQRGAAPLVSFNLKYHHFLNLAAPLCHFFKILVLQKEGQLTVKHALTHLVMYSTVITIIYMYPVFAHWYRYSIYM